MHDELPSDVPRLTERDVAALRTLRPLAEGALRLASEQLLTMGRDRELTDALHALAVIDRLTGSAGSLTREEHQLTCIRVGAAAGFVVSFETDGAVEFARDDVALLVADNLLEMNEPIEEHLTQLLADVDGAYAAFMRWLHRSDEEGAP
jgi:hypothetical protein